MSEKDYILFSPVGTTDPISKNSIDGETKHFDGSMVHICREYRPKLVVLYFTQEMHALEELDQRFTKSLELLGAELHCKFKIVSEPQGDYIAEAHDFEAFYDVFEDLIRNLHEEFPNANLLLNTSSGTPAMKTALYLLANYLPFAVIPVQVESPAHAANRKDWLEEAGRSLEEIWLDNSDNDPMHEVRCKQSTFESLNTRITKLHIRKLIDAYDYAAAQRLAENIKDSLSEDALQYLSDATKRINQDWENISTASAQIFDVPERTVSSIERAFTRANQSGVIRITGLPEALCDEDLDKPYEETFPLKEYLLWLQTKQQRRDYSDFVRGLSPALFNLQFVAVELILGLPLRSTLSSRNKQGAYRIKKKALETFLEQNDYLSEETEGILKVFKANSNTRIIDTYIYDKVIITLCRETTPWLRSIHRLRELEEQVRHKAAHDIHGIDEEWIKRNNEWGYSSAEIMRLIKECVEALALEGGEPILDIDWDSYSKMNQIIKDSL